MFLQRSKSTILLWKTEKLHSFSPILTISRKLLAIKTTLPSISCLIPKNSRLVSRLENTWFILHSWPILWQLFKELSKHKFKSWTRLDQGKRRSLKFQIHTKPLPIIQAVFAPTVNSNPIKVVRHNNPSNTNNCRPRRKRTKQFREMLAFYVYLDILCIGC